VTQKKKWEGNKCHSTPPSSNQSNTRPIQPRKSQTKGGGAALYNGGAGLEGENIFGKVRLFAKARDQIGNLNDRVKLRFRKLAFAAGAFLRGGVAAVRFAISSQFH
jgi:hypothetical protein